VESYRGILATELDDVQSKWGLRFPPDLIERLRECRPLIDHPQCFDWVTADPEHIRERLAWPFESYWRSIEINDFWWPEWGERPASQVDQKEKLRGIISAAPKLIPLMGIRYIPDEPYESSVTRRRSARVAIGEASVRFVTLRSSSDIVFSLKSQYPM
jgi:hypothetical protein